MRLTQTATTTNPHDCRWAPTFMFATFLEEQRWARSKYSELSTHLLPLALWYGLRPFPFGGIPPFTHTHTSPPPPPPPLSQQLCFLFDLLMFSWKAETLQTETRLRAERDSHTSSYLFFFSFFFSCHLIDLITWSILLNNVSHLVPLFWNLSISCLLRDLRGEALFALMSADGPLRTYTTVSEVWIMEQDYKGLRIESTWSDYQTFTIRCMFDHGVSGGPYNFGSLYTPNGLSGTI